MGIQPLSEGIPPNLHGLTYYWLVKYKDGSQLQQFEMDGKEHLFKEIDQSRLDTYTWMPFDASKPSYTLKLEPWQRLIAAKTHRLITSLRTGIKSHTITYLLGWQTTHQGRNFKSIMYIKPDGDVILSEEL